MALQHTRPFAARAAFWRPFAARAAFWRPFAARAAFWLVVLGLGPTAPGWAEEDPPVCIMNDGDQLVVRPGPCPDLTRTGPSDTERTTDKTPAPEPIRVPARAAQGWEDPNPPGPLTQGQVRSTLSEMASAASEEVGLQAFEGLVARGPSIVPALTVVFLDNKEDPRVRWVAGRALGRIPSGASLDALEKGFKDSVPLVRVASVKAATELNARALLPAIEAAVGDRAAVVRAAALDGVGQLGSRSEVSVVARQLKDSRNFAKGRSIFVRTHAVTALTRLGGREAIDALVTVADDADPEVQELAREGLLRLTGRNTIPIGSGTAAERWRTWLAGQK